MNKPHLRYISATVVALVVMASVIFYIRSARRPLSDRATGFTQAMVRGDAAALMATATTREVEEGKLTQAKLQQVLDHVLLPQLSAGKTATVLGTQDDTGDVHGMTIMSVPTAAGAPTTFGWDVYETESGPRSPVLKQVLISAWLLRFGHKDGKDYPRGEQFRAVMAGIRADGTFLKSIGLAGITPIEPEKKFATWDQMRVHCVKMLAAYMAQE
jgi:hypothetical protein